ncbi:MAG: flagellar hook-length control protein FliK [Thiobacillus sp.]|nr:flagellar hook-length control protein FliK [Thiobacillus sp.]
MFPVQYLARILDVPPTLDTPGRSVSGLAGVQPVLNATQRDQAAPRAAFELLVMGQTLTGQVKSVAKGLSLVEVEGQTVAMRLPRETAPGDTLRLRFAGHMPQPVFLLEAPDTAASDAPQLSQTARMLSDLMQQLPGRNALPTVTPPGPLLDQPTANPAMLAIALRTALVRSGLFYESHLANWAVGEDNLDGLMQEPQNRLAAAETARTAASPASALALLDTADTAGPKPLNPMHTLLSQQLQVLESPQFVWRGEVWPGQTLEWQLHQETHPAQDRATAATADEAGAGWESHLKLTLPHLGTVTVHIKLDAQQAFSIRMTPEQPATQPLLLQNQVRLAEQLKAAGCTLNSLKVERDGDA